MMHWNREFKGLYSDYCQEKIKYNCKRYHIKMNNRKYLISIRDKVTILTIVTTKKELIQYSLLDRFDIKKFTKQKKHIGINESNKWLIIEAYYTTQLQKLEESKYKLVLEF